ncbi:F-box/LRR-repeat protein 3-like isoform X1 [Tripterygium wilfordii]|uniref:F-box/LRR-repeat protein 3-like isoform X1 n=1 Tax=Tripterygium wilfordii TaxID=458696 RepID=A0A7J7D0X5_TRIWF|nr:F-box/LRR-repeat protein 3 [Tripterygium wilfordii]KAF5740022.1 F-box/LRR-repeat protein 3-like isoform X1 [Tripterygium wilfordii]
MPAQSMVDVLTEDLLARVYEKLASDLDRKTWRLVCKEYHRVDLVTRSTLRVLRLEFLLSLLQKYANIETLDLSVCPRIDCGTVSLLVNRNAVDRAAWTQGLRNLVLSRANGLRAPGLGMLVQACPCLEYVDVSYCWAFGDREAAVLSGAARLKVLKMDKCLGVSDVGLAKIAVGCGRLEGLSLKWCMEITDLGLDLLCKKCRTLKSLDVSYLKVTNESLCSIASLPKLEVLTMVGCPLVDDTGLQYLENGCPLLQMIDVTRCDCVSSSGLISVIRGHKGLLELSACYCIWELSTTFLSCMKDLNNLNSIRIDGAQVSDSTFQVMSANCKSLSEIGLGKCIGVTDRGIMQLVSDCVNLKILNLTCCHSLTDAAISAIANSCRKLASLKLESCDMITEKGLFELGSYSLLLEELDLTDCHGVNDIGLKYLSGCSEMLCLTLGLCTNISDEGLCHIGSNHPKLLELDLYRCTGIGDDGLAVLSNGCKKLKKLNLSYCNGITDRGMESIAYFEELCDMEMRGLKKVTDVGLKAVAAGCKRLADLDLKHCDNIDDLGFWALAYYARNLRQVNLSFCALSNMALCTVMGNLTRLQDAKLVQLPNVTVEGFELALRACSVRIKKIKLLASLRLWLSSETLEILHSSGCKIRWD